MRFFRYAVGEIFLGVVGMLIAPQINNGNGRRKQRELERNDLAIISNDAIKNGLPDIDSVTWP